MATDLIEAIVSDTLRREREGSEVPVHPNLCGPCPECSEFFESASLDASSGESAYWAGFGEPPTRESLRRHLDHYGPAGMEPWGIAATRKRAPGRDLVREVAPLLERGLTPSAIADVLGVSDRRVRAVAARLRKSAEKTA